MALALNKETKSNQNFIKKAMENWKVELAAGEQTITDVKIQRDFFQGDT